MTYKKVEKDDYVFKVGDKGTTFYIILEGSVRILAPYNDQESDVIEYNKDMLTHEVARRNAGHHFGEFALIYDTPRTASVIANQISHLAVLKKEDYDEMLAEDEIKDLGTFVATLQQCPMFSKWTKTSLCKMSFYFKTVDYLRNHVVYNEGDDASDIFIVVGGDFMLTKKIPGKKIKGEMVILGSGQMAG